MSTSFKSPLCIAIVGPESCGKSTLAEDLARYLQSRGLKTGVVAEYARHYYATREYAPTAQDILAIARGQLAAEAEAVAAGAQVLLCDTTVLTCRIWAEVAFGKADHDLLALDRPQAYALTVLASPDIPWQADPLRSHPLQRNWLFGLYQAALHAAGVIPLQVAGSRQERVALVWQRLQQDYGF